MKNELIAPGIAWTLITLLCLLIIIIGLKKVLDKTSWGYKKKINFLIIAIASISLWTLLLVVLSFSGFFSDFSKMPPKPLFALLLPLPFIILFTFSTSGKQLLLAVPPHWLIYMQTFRIAVEILLLLAFLKKLLPVQMTFEGRNFDILTGILAIPAGYLVAQKKLKAKWTILLFNIIGILLLMNILAIAVLSMPIPIRYFINEPANTIVAEFPFILLPGVLVPIAYSFHIFSLRQLQIQKSNLE